MFRDTPVAYGHVHLKTWDKLANEYLCRSFEACGDLHNAILRAERDGFAKRRRIRADIHNLVENAGFDLLLAFLNSESVTGINYVALGQSSTAPTGTENQLVDEQIRMTTASTSRSPGQLVITGFFDTTQANVLLGSAALFGNGATSTANSGTIYSYVTYNQFTKNNLESLTVQWTLGFQRPAS